MAMRVLLMLICMLFTMLTMRALPEPSADDHNAVIHACGKQMHSQLMEYSHYHTAVLSGKLSQRYLISIPVEAGFGDRLTGVISEFWLAVLSHRALQLSNIPTLPHFEYAFDYRFINFTRPAGDPEELVHNMLFRTARDHDEQPIPYSSELQGYYQEYVVNKDAKVASIFGAGDLAHYPLSGTSAAAATDGSATGATAAADSIGTAADAAAADAAVTTASTSPHTVVMTSNRGGLHYLFDHNPVMRKYFEARNVSKEQAFRCAFTFLFRPNQAVKDVLMSTPVVPRAELVRIGIKVRVGDHAFGPNHHVKVIENAQYRDMLRCAQQMEDAWYNQSTITQRLPWVFQSESLSLRKDVARMYGNKVQVDTRTMFQHGNCKGTRSNCSTDLLRHAFVYGVADVLAFAACNVHIYSAGSGFSRVAVALASPPYRIIPFDERMQLPCSLENTVSLADVMATPAGI